MVRVALIAGTYAPDRCGVAHYTAHLRAALGIESIVLTTHDAAKGDATVIGAVNDWNIQNLAALVTAIHQQSIDLLHIQHAAGTYGFDRAIFLLPLLLRLSGWTKPIVTTIHEYGWWEWEPKWIPQSVLESIKQFGQQRSWWDREDGFLITGSNAIVTTHDAATQIIHDRLPQFKSVYQISIGANIQVSSIDRQVARQKMLETIGWKVTQTAGRVSTKESEELQIITFFGFLHPVKGLETLFKAFQKVVQSQPQARLLLIGGVESLALKGEDADRYWNILTETIATLGLEDVVHRTNYVDAETASQYLSASDIGVLPFHPGVTLKSGSLLAMMAHRLPIVATDAIGLPVKSVPPRDVDSLTTALLNLLTNSLERSQLSNAGFELSRSFSWDTIAQQHLEIYRSLVPHE